MKATECMNIYTYKLVGRSTRYYIEKFVYYIIGDILLISSSCIPMD